MARDAENDGGLMNPVNCPSCGEKGRKVHAVTPRSVLAEGALARLGDDPELRFCRNGDCAIVYFGGGEAPFETGDVRVPVFQKSTEPERLVCYCFEHSVASLLEQVTRTGASAVPDEITGKCRQGLDRCEEMNPQGSCCLGNVRKLVKDAAARSDTQMSRQDDGDHDCCSSKVGDST